MSEELKTDIQELDQTTVTLRIGKMVAYKRIGDKIEQLIPAAQLGKLTAGKVLIELIDYLADQIRDIERDLNEPVAEND
jgi:hypothetical protein